MIIHPNPNLLDTRDSTYYHMCFEFPSYLDKENAVPVGERYESNHSIISCGKFFTTTTRLHRYTNSSAVELLRG